MIKLSNIKKIYKGSGIETVALQGVSMEVKKSEFISIMGRSGCGKSTLLNILGCMDSYDDGEYIFDDVNVKRLNSIELARFRNKKIGFVFQAFNLINEMTAFENVEIPLGYGGVSQKLRRDRIHTLLDAVGLLDKMNSYPGQMSGGQQQRLAIARALANNPEVILADEPTGNLDSKNGIEIMELLCTLNNTGTTIILVTHDNNIASYAKRRITLGDGIIINDIRSDAR